MNIAVFLPLILLFCVVNSQENLLKEMVTVLESPTVFANELKKYAFKNRSLSEKCSDELHRYGNDLWNIKLWALKMFDATGKIPSGILEGNLMELGSFHECINTQEKSATTEINGKYCIAGVQTRAVSNKYELNLTKMLVLPPADLFKINIGVCFPSSCNKTEIEHMYNSIGININIHEPTCQTKESQPNLDVGAIVVLCMFGITLCWIIVSTVYDAIMQHLHKEPMHYLLITFSVLSNGRKLFASNKSADEVACLHGIRVISTMLVILGHAFFLQCLMPIKNYSYLLEWITNEYNMYIINATIAVDTFLLISGFTISYVFMIYSRKGIKFNLLVFYIHRYLRLTPALAVMILIYLYLSKYIGSGPFWYTIHDTLIATCEKNWWRALLYIQNYGTIDQYCLSHSWYLSVDMQLFVVSPLLLIPLLRWSQLTLYVTGFLTLCSVAACFAVSWIYEMPTTLVADNGLYLKYYYTATYARAAPWLIGFILGYILEVGRRKPSGIVLNRLLVLVLWILALITLCVIVFGGHDLIFENGNVLKKSFYNSLIRVTWAIAISWIIFACQFGYGGIVNWFLSLSIFKVLSKLTFTLYLTHFIIITATLADTKDIPTLSNAFMLRNVWVYYALTLFASIVLSLSFESPIIAVERILLKTIEKRNPATTQVT